MRKIVLAKLINGMFVIGRQDNDFIDQAYMVQVIPNPKIQGAMQVLIVSLFMPLSQDPATIIGKDILSTITCPKDLEDEYTRITTGLHIATESDLRILNNTRG